MLAWGNLFRIAASFRLEFFPIIQKPTHTKANDLEEKKVFKALRLSSLRLSFSIKEKLLPFSRSSHEKEINIYLTWTLKSEMLLKMKLI